MAAPQAGLTCHAALRRTCVCARHPLLGHPLQPCRKAQKVAEDAPQNGVPEQRGGGHRGRGRLSAQRLAGQSRLSHGARPPGVGKGPGGAGGAAVRHLQGGGPSGCSGRSVQSLPGGGGGLLSSGLLLSLVLVPCAECALLMGSQGKFKFKFTLSSFLCSRGLNFFFCSGGVGRAVPQRMPAGPQANSGRSCFRVLAWAGREGGVPLGFSHPPYLRPHLVPAQAQQASSPENRPGPASA